MTNYERIMNMNIEELAAFLGNIHEGDDFCTTKRIGGDYVYDGDAPMNKKI